MEIQVINGELIEALHEQARVNERRRVNYDLRTTPEDGSQRMLNVLEVGTRIPIHRHEKTSETIICLEGCLDWIVYEEIADAEAEAMVDAEAEERKALEQGFREVARYRLCPREKAYGIQVPPMTWHSVEVIEPSTILEAKDGKYGV